MPILGFNYFGKNLHRILSNEDISEYKHISDMADFLDFRLSPKMHLKIKFFMGFLPKNTRMCKWMALL